LERFPKLKGGLLEKLLNPGLWEGYKFSRPVLGGEPNLLPGSRLKV